MYYIYCYKFIWGLISRHPGIYKHRSCKVEFLYTNFKSGPMVTGIVRAFQPFFSKKPPPPPPPILVKQCVLCKKTLNLLKIWHGCDFCCTLTCYHTHRQIYRTHINKYWHQLLCAHNSYLYYNKRITCWYKRVLY